MRQRMSSARSATVAKLPHAQLVSRYVQSGDSTAFEALVAQLSPGLLASLLASHGAQRRSEAEAAVQDAWVALARQAASIKEPAAVPGWLLVTARRAMSRSLRTPGDVIGIDPEHQAAPDRQLADAETSDLLSQELAGLDQRERQTFEWYAIDGLSLRAIANRLGMSRSATATLIDRIRALLRSRLLARGIAPGVVLGLGLHLPATAIETSVPALVKTALASGSGAAAPGTIAAFVLAALIGAALLIAGLVWLPQTPLATAANADAPAPATPMPPRSAPVTTSPALRPSDPRPTPSESPIAVAVAEHPIIPDAPTPVSGTPAASISSPGDPEPPLELVLADLKTRKITGRISHRSAILDHANVPIASSLPTATGSRQTRIAALVCLTTYQIVYVSWDSYIAAANHADGSCDLKQVAGESVTRIAKPIDRLTAEEKTRYEAHVLSRQHVGIGRRNGQANTRATIR